MPFAGYKDFDECVAKNSDKSNPQAYCGSIQAKVEEANVIYAKEDQAVNDPESLTTPDAGNEPEDVTKDLTSPTGSSREAENPQASGDGELSPTNPPQDQAEPEANPQDQARPENVGHQTEVSPDSEIKTNDKYGELNGDKYAKNEDELKDERRDEHQGQASEQDDDEEDKLEYEGESYHKIKAIEYEEIIYVMKDDGVQAKEEDIEYEDKFYEEAEDDVLQLDDDYYIKDEEQAPMDIGGSVPVAIDTPELNPVMGEALIIKDKNGVYRKYSVFEENKVKANEQEDNSIIPPAEVPDVPKIETPISEPNVVEEPKVQPIEQPKDASEEIKAVEKIIVKENGKLRFKSVYQEVKKKLTKTK